MPLVPFQPLVGAGGLATWVLDALPDGVVVVDARGIVREANVRAAEMFGFDHGALTDVDLGTLLPDLIGALGAERFRSFTGRRADGAEFPVDVTVMSQSLAGQPVVVVVFRDMSEQRALEREAIEAGMRIRQVAENLDTMFILHQFDPPGYLYVSPGARTVVGCEPEELIALAEPLDVVYPHDRERFIKEYMTPFEQRKPAVCEHRVLTLDGRCRWVRSFVHPIINIRGAPEQAIITVEDITDKVLALQALKKAEQAARQANEAKSKFMSRMSHELRTPLNSVLGFGQLLAMELEEPTQVAAVQQIVGSGRHLLELINDIMDIARIEGGETSVRLTAVPVGELVRDCAVMVNPMAITNNITISVSAGSPDVVVLADTQRLRQMLLNLLSNAIKYNRPGGHVSVSWANQDDRVAIAVADDGVGLSAVQQARLFTPFDRLGADETSIEGTGLGLTLTRSLAQMMNGSVSVHSVMDKGSVFTLDLPSAPRDAGVHDA